MPEVRRRRSSSPLARRWRRIRRSPARFRTFVGAIVLVVASLLWCGWTVWSTARDLKEVEQQARIMRAALVRGDVEGGRRALEKYREAADSAADHTSGPTWAVFERVPVLGDDAEAVSVVSRVLSDVGGDGLEPVTSAAEGVTADAFQPLDFRFPLDRIAALEEPAARSERAFDEAAATLADVDATRLAGPIRTRFAQLRQLVDDARGTLGSTYRAARLMPPLLGQDEQRTYLLVFQNNAESRSSGGLPGSISLVQARNGSVRIVEQKDASDLTYDGRAALPLSAEERTVFGKVLGTAPVDAALTPDFPRAADLLRAHWERSFGGRIDGVFFIDPVAVSYFLQGTGPVAAEGYPPVDASNLVANVENTIYRLTPRRAEHSDYQNAVARGVFDAFAQGRGSVASAIRALVRGVDEGRIRMHLFRAAEQDEIAGTDIAGEFVGRDTDRPQVGVYVNDAGPTKMQYYLRASGQAYARSCIDGVQRIGGSFDLRSIAPQNADELPPSITGKGFPGQRADPGDQLLVIYLTSPVGGDLEQLSIDGQAVQRPVTQSYGGRKVATVGLTVAPGERHQVEFSMVSGPGQTGDIELWTSPGAAPGSSNRTVGSACRIR